MQQICKDDTRILNQGFVEEVVRALCETPLLQNVLTFCILCMNLFVGIIKGDQRSCAGSVQSLVLYVTRAKSCVQAVDNYRELHMSGLVFVVESVEVFFQVQVFHNMSNT